MHLYHTEEEVDVTYIHSKNETNNISINDHANVLHTYYAPLLLSNNQKDVSTGT